MCPLAPFPAGCPRESGPDSACRVPSVALLLAVKKPRDPFSAPGPVGPLTGCQATASPQQCWRVWAPWAPWGRAAPLVPTHVLPGVPPGVSTTAALEAGPPQVRPVAVD